MESDNADLVVETGISSLEVLEAFVVLENGRDIWDQGVGRIDSPLPRSDHQAVESLCKYTVRSCAQSSSEIPGRVEALMQRTDPWYASRLVRRLARNACTYRLAGTTCLRRFKLFSCSSRVRQAPESTTAVSFVGFDVGFAHPFIK